MFRQASWPAPDGSVARRPSVVRVPLHQAVVRASSVRQWSHIANGAWNPAGQLVNRQQSFETHSHVGALYGAREATAPSSLSVSASAWKECVSRFKPSEKRLFREVELESVEDLLVSAMSAAKSQDDKSRALQIARKVQPLVDCVNLYAGVAQTMVQANPSPAAFVLGGISCLMSLPTRFLEYQDSISAILFAMGRKFYNLNKYNDLFYENEPDIEDALIQVYIAIVEFCREASKLLYDEQGNPRSLSRTIVKSIWQPFQAKLGALEARFNADVEYFEDCIRVANQRKQQRLQRQLKQMYDNQTEMGTNTLQISFMTGRILTDTHQIGFMQEVQLIAKLDENRAKKKKAILKWLSAIPFSEDQEDHFGKRLEGTGTWLLREEKFKEWKRKAKANSLPPNILCIQGKSGCGKSCLAALVIDKYIKKATKNPSKIGLAYAYCSKMNNKTKANPVRILASLLEQLSRGDPSSKIDAALEKLYDVEKGQGQFPPTQNEMEEMIPALASKFKKVYIIVDGLDECYGHDDVNFGDFCKSLRKIAHAKPAIVRLILFHRPNYREIERYFGFDPNIDVDRGANEDDIKQYISVQMSGEELRMWDDPELLKLIEGELLEKADGMFLWVQLLIQTLKTACTEKQLRARLTLLPKKLHKIYDDIMNQILKRAENADLALNILLWVANAKQALSREELKVALAIEEGSTMLDNRNLPKRDQDFTRECGDLIVLRDNHYYLLHSSLQEYLTKLEMSDSVQAKEYRDLQVNAHKILGRVCLTYLMFDSLRMGPFESLHIAGELLKQYSFLAYAERCWGSHVIDAGEKGFGSLIADFVTCDPARELFIQFHHHFEGNDNDVCPYEGSTNPLHALSIFNLVEAAKALQGSLQLRRSVDGFGYLPLDYALAEARRDICIWLLQDDRSLEETTVLKGSKYMAIHVATIHDWGDVVRRLIAVGFDPKMATTERQRTALHEAASKGCLNALAALIEAKVDVDAEDVDKQTALIEAVEGNHEKAFQILLDAGANIHHRGWEDLTVLHQAALTGNLAVAKVLLQRHAEVDAVSGPGWSHRTPLHVAAENDNQDVLRLLLANNAQIERQCAQKYTALLLAASGGSLKAIKVLLEHKADLSARTDNGETALHLAAMNGHAEVVKLLWNASPGLIHVVDEDKNTPLHSALIAREAKISLFLLTTGSVVEATDIKGQTPLHLVISHNMDDKVIQSLIVEHLADTNKKGVLGSSPLHYAAHWGHSHMIESLVVRGKADPNALNDHQQSAVHFAAKEKHIDFIKELVKLAPSTKLGENDKWKQTPLHLAARAGAVEIVRYLTVERKMPSTEDSDKNLPLHLAAWNGHVDCVEYLLTRESLNSKGYCGRSPLFGAAAWGHLKTVQLLLSWNADPNVLDEDLQGPLISALKNKHVAIASLLLEHAADPKTPDRWDSTPLYFAAGLGDKHLTNFMLEKGCDGLSQNFFYDTPFFKAVESDEVEIVEMFLHHGFNGCHIKNSRGVHVDQIAARNGNLKMLERILKAAKDVGADQIHLEPDLLGFTSLTDAATSGEVALIEPLLKAGLNIDGPEKAYETPLTQAVDNGNIFFVKALLAKAAEIDIVSEQGFTPICSAAANQFPIIFKLLHNAEADLQIRDVYGCNALDYAHRCPIIWSGLDKSLTEAYEPLDDITKRKILQDTICKSAETIMELGPVLTADIEVKRLVSMSILANACSHLETESGNTDALVGYKEICNPPETNSFGVTLKCYMCMETPIKGSVYVCPMCYSSDICETCYEEWVKGSDIPKSLPESLRILERLESEVKPIRTSVARIVPVGAEFVFDTLDTLKPIQRWFQEKVKAYKTWEEQYNIGGRFNAREMPGRDFLNIMVKAQEIQNANIQKSNEANKDSSPTQDTNVSQDESRPLAIENGDTTTGPETKEKSFEDLDKELAQLFKKFRADKETATFFCSGHERIEVERVKWANEDTSTGPFDENGRATNEWLGQLLKRYQQTEPIIPEEIISAEPLEMDDTKETQILVGPILSQEMSQLQSEYILTPAQADAVFASETKQQIVTAGPVDPESASELRLSDPESDADPMDVSKDASMQPKDLLPENSLTRRATIDVLGEIDRARPSPSRNPTLDFLQEAAHVALPASRQGTFDLEPNGKVATPTRVVSANTYEDGPRLDQSTGPPTPLQPSESDKDPVLEAKLSLVSYFYTTLRKILADDATTALRLCWSCEGMSDGGPGLTIALQRASARRQQAQDENTGSAELTNLDRVLFNLRAKMWQWDASFDVVQHVVLGVAATDLVPDFNLDRLLVEEERVVPAREDKEDEAAQQPQVEPDDEDTTVPPVGEPHANGAVEPQLSPDMPANDDVANHVAADHGDH